QHWCHPTRARQPEQPAARQPVSAKRALTAITPQADRDGLGHGGQRSHGSNQQSVIGRRRKKAPSFGDQIDELPTPPSKEFAKHSRPISNFSRAAQPIL